MRRFLGWLTGNSGSEFVANWSAERAKHYEAKTYRYLGIRPEAIHVWSEQYRRAAKKAAKKRKSADVLTPKTWTRQRRKVG